MTAGRGRQVVRSGKKWLVVEELDARPDEAFFGIIRYTSVFFYSEHEAMERLRELNERDAAYVAESADLRPPRRRHDIPNGSDGMATCASHKKCRHCGEEHDYPVIEDGFGYRARSPVGAVWVCPKMGTREQAIERVDLLVARVTGQPPQPRENLLDEAAREVMSWGDEQRREFINHPVLGPYIRERMRWEAKWEEEDREDGLIGHNNELTPEDKARISEHLPLVRRAAADRAGGNQEVFSDLEALGLGVLEDEVRNFDPTRGVTFGAFIQKRVKGEMDNHLSRDRIQTLSLRAGVPEAVEKYARSLWWADANANAPKKHRSSTGAFKQKNYIDGAVRRLKKTEALIRTGQPQTAGLAGRPQTANEEAISKLNPRQLVVYRGRVMSDPPVPLSALAEELGVSRPNVSRILDQALRKLRRIG